MSALAAIFRPGGPDRARSDCAAMLAAQTIFGRSATGQRRSGDVAMGRCLHALLAEDRFDRQPIAGGDGRFLLVADLRIDNREELLEALGRPACDAAGLADAQILMAAWERWGEQALDRVLGDYAFALWDARSGEMLLVRDPAGVRPLHYHAGQGFFAVASMIRGLHALGDIPREVDRAFLAATAGFATKHADHCHFRDIRRVVPGHILRLSARGISSRRFWDPPRRMLRLPSHEDYAEALRETFDRAVGVRLRGVDRIASHLSGGLDSTAVTVTAARALGERGSVTAYTSVPREGYAARAEQVNGRFLDEWAPAAKAAAMAPNIEHVAVHGDTLSFNDALEHYSQLVERPAVAPPNIPWLLAINDAARNAGHRVLLTGQCGNITFSHSGEPLFAERLGRLQLAALLRDVADYRRAGSGKAISALRMAVMGVLPVRAQRRIVTARQSGALGLVDRDLPTGFAGSALSRGGDRRDAVLRYFAEVEYGAQMKAQLGGWGLELRDPTADRRLIELSLAIPEEQFLHRGIKRALARTMLADRLPPEVVQQRQRGLQAADWHEAFVAQRENIAARLASMADYPELAGVLDFARLQADMASLPESGWNAPANAARYRSGVLRALAIGAFVRQAGGHNR